MASGWTNNNSRNWILLERSKAVRHSISFASNASVPALRSRGKFVLVFCSPVLSNTTVALWVSDPSSHYQLHSTAKRGRTKKKKKTNRNMDTRFVTFPTRAVSNARAVRSFTLATLSPYSFFFFYSYRAQVLRIQNEMYPEKEKKN